MNPLGRDDRFFSPQRARFARLSTVVSRSVESGVSWRDLFGNVRCRSRALEHPRMRNAFVVGLAALPALLAFGKAASAEPLRLHATAAAARATGGFQEYEYGWGAGVLPALELPLTGALGAQAELSAIWLSEANKPKNPNIEPEGQASGYSLAIGPRLRPFAASHDSTSISPAGFWLSGSAGVTLTNSLWRPMLDAQIGYDFLDSRGRLGIGPVLGYYHVFQSDDNVRPDDAHLLLVGVHVMFDPAATVQRRGDRDGDGLFDDEDACPDKPEDKDGFEDTDGCPDLDDDKDGILDPSDHCPRVPEDKDGFEDGDGCPDPDNDKDGILDGKDKCPNQAEDKDSFEDEDGCPDPDNDKDGIPDVEDLCPFEPETVNGYADSDGCPDEDQVRVLGDKIVLDDRVHFMVNSHIIRRESFGLLTRLAKLIKDHPEYVHVSIEGHADERGAEDFNQKLSENRASSVMDFLVKSGVAASRLSSKGYGSTRPLVDRKSELAYFHNRRVEFIITREGRGSTGPLLNPLKPGSLGSDGPPLPEEDQKKATETTQSGAGQVTLPPPAPTPPPPAPPPPSPPPAAPKAAPPGATGGKP
jgi:outer membrane protein OmpA-like peptidoglycan-associated protein